MFGSTQWNAVLINSLENSVRILKQLKTLNNKNEGKVFENTDKLISNLSKELHSSSIQISTLANSPIDSYIAQQIQQINESIKIFQENIDLYNYHKTNKSTSVLNRTTFLIEPSVFIKKLSDFRAFQLATALLMREYYTHQVTTYISDADIRKKLELLINQSKKIEDLISPSKRNQDVTLSQDDISSLKQFNEDCSDLDINLHLDYDRISYVSDDIIEISRYLSNITQILLSPDFLTGEIEKHLIASLKNYMQAISNDPKTTNYHTFLLEHLDVFTVAFLKKLQEKLPLCSDIIRTCKETQPILKKLHRLRDAKSDYYQYLGNFQSKQDIENFKDGLTKSIPLFLSWARHLSYLLLSNLSRKKPLANKTHPILEQAFTNVNQFLAAFYSQMDSHTMAQHATPVLYIAQEYDNVKTLPENLQIAVNNLKTSSSNLLEEISEALRFSSKNKSTSPSLTKTFVTLEELFFNFYQAMSEFTFGLNENVFAPTFQENSTSNITAYNYEMNTPVDNTNFSQNVNYNDQPQNTHNARNLNCNNQPDSHSIPSAFNSFINTSVPDYTPNFSDVNSQPLQISVESENIQNLNNPLPPQINSQPCVLVELSLLESLLNEVSMLRQSSISQPRQQFPNTPHLSEGPSSESFNNPYISFPSLPNIPSNEVPALNNSQQLPSYGYSANNSLIFTHLPPVPTDPLLSQPTPPTNERQLQQYGPAPAPQ